MLNSQSKKVPGRLRRAARTVRQYVYKDSGKEELKVLEFDLPENLVVESLIGKGAYGTVVCAQNTHDGTRVAVKKVTLNGNPLMCQRTLREVKLLRHFAHPNIVRVLDVPPPLDARTMDSIYIVQELMTTDLHAVVRSAARRAAPIDNDVARHVLWQLLQGVKALHAADVLHRDLKPANVLLDADCNVKICDFGLARPVLQAPDAGAPTDGSTLTQYVATRWYRAPELLLQSAYTQAIDMWSVGCIFAEILGLAPLCPGRDFIDQMRLSLEVSGGLCADNLAAVPGDEMRAFLAHTVRNIRQRDVGTMYPRAQPAMVALLRAMLVFDPYRRVSAADALQHACFADYDHAQPYPEAPAIAADFFDFEQDLYTLDADVHRRVAVRELGFEEQCGGGRDKV